jgi:hypothetical protein
MNKLISLTSEGKFSIIDSVVENVSKRTEEKKNSSNGKSSSYGKLFTQLKGSST